MRDTDQFARLLGIKAPWRVALVEVNEETLMVLISVRLDDSAKLRCPHCRAVAPRYDHRRCRWRHLNTMQFQTFVEADVPRIECAEHGVVQIRVPWTEDASRYTVAFESLVIDWLRDASTSAVAKHLSLGWSAVNGIMQRAVDRGLSRRTSTPPIHLSVDETSFQRRHEYVTVVTDQITGAVRYVADNRTKETLAGFFNELSSDDCSGIQSVSMDMWPAYINVVRAFVPDADRKICFDKFHVAKYLGDAVDKVRRGEQKQLIANGDDRLTGTRYRWLEHPINRAEKHRASFRQLRDSALKTARVWAIKEHAMCLWKYVSRTWATKAWRDWIYWAANAGYPPMRSVARTINDHLWGIINAVVLKRSNAIAESTNSRIQRVKSRACGFRNRDRFRTAIMFHLGKLDLYPRVAEFS